MIVTDPKDIAHAEAAAGLVVETHRRLVGFLRTGQTLAEIDAHPALSRGTITEFGKPMRIAAAIRAMREFDPESRIPVQPGVIGPVAGTPTDDMFIWRVTETDPAHDPASLDEVRDAVMKDAVSEMRYEKLAAM